MDAQKIGIFIQTIRKEKGMTQKDLAEKLNVSINAVSKWERGLCLMDVSLLKPLSEILEVSIAEIITAEKIQSNDLSNEIMEKTMNYYEQKHKEQKKRKYRILLITSFILLASWFCFYKTILLYNIKSLENNIAERSQEFGTQNYHSDIHILKKDSNNYYVFKDMKLDNIFDNVIEKRTAKCYETFEFENNKVISLQIHQNSTSILEDVDNLSLRNYIANNGLTAEKNLMYFLSSFELENTSIFKSISTLKKYFLKLSVYNLYSFPFDDYYNIIGSYQGYILINNYGDTISFHLNGIYNEYTIHFLGYTLDEAIKIVETIEFTE